MKSASQLTAFAKQNEGKVPIEKIMIRVMMALGIVFILLDITYYSARSTPYLVLLTFVLLIGDKILPQKNANSKAQSRLSRGVEKVLLILIGLTVIGLLISLTVMWKMGHFGRL